MYACSAMRSVQLLKFLMKLAFTSLEKLKSDSAFLISVCAMILFASPSVEASEDFDKKLSKASDLLNNGKAKSAASIAKAIIASDPNIAQAHTILGAALASEVNNNEYDAAIAEEQLALKLDPKSYWARKFLGHIYTNMHKSQEAISMLEEAAAINPSSYSARRDLGIAQMTAGKNEDAVKSFRKAIQINGTKVDPHVKLSALLIKMDNSKEAIVEARKAIKLDVSNPETHLALANAILASGDKIGSLDSYEEALQTNWSKSYRNPLTAASAMSGIGWAYSGANAGKKELAEAVSYQHKAIKIFPGFGPAYVRLAELLGRQGKINDADNVYKSSIKMSQDDPSVSTAYAKFLVKTGRSGEARVLLKKVLEKAPDFKQASEILAELGSEKAS